MMQCGLMDLVDVLKPIYILFLYTFHVLVHFIVKFVQKSRLCKITLNNSMLQCGILVDFGGLLNLKSRCKKMILNMDKWIFYF